MEKKKSNLKLDKQLKPIGNAINSMIPNIEEYLLDLEVDHKTATKAQDFINEWFSKQSDIRGTLANLASNIRRVAVDTAKHCNESHRRMIDAALYLECGLMYNGDASDKIAAQEPIP